MLCGAMLSVKGAEGLRGFPSTFGTTEATVCR